MKMPRFARTISFRLATLYAVLFGASAALLFGFIYWIATDSLYEQLRLSLATEMASFETISAAEPSDEVVAEIDRRLAASAPQLLLYSLRDPSGRQIAGNLPGIDFVQGLREIPYGSDVHEGFSGLAPRDGLDHSLLVLGRTLPDGTRLSVATDTVRLQEAAESMLQAFAWAAGATLLLAVIGGFALSHGFLRRVDGINRTMRAIMRGDLSDRIESRGTGDELDQLGRNLNDMLERLQFLVEGLKQVSNDIAHDLRTPLSRLKQRLEAARNDANSIDDYEQAIDEALQDADLALSIFSALLRIAQIESGTRRGNFADIDLSALMTDLVMTYAAVAEDGGRYLTYSVAPDICVHGDRELLTQLFVNLIENALRHTPDGAQVKVSLMNGSQGAVVEIADNGLGIPEAERVNVFKRFYRLEGSRSRPGNGLGLALVAAVTDLHDARIDLADNHPGLKVTLRFGGQAVGLHNDAASRGRGRAFAHHRTVAAGRPRLARQRR